jgi:DNA-binding beta-propeller fold protein YncE
VKRLAISAFLIVCAGCAGSSVTTPSYLFMWAGDKDGKSDDFLAVIDATPTSATYGTVITTLPVGVSGTHPHHTEHELPPNGHLLANGFGAGRTWLFDLTAPASPKVLASFGDLDGFSHPHTFVRLSDDRVLTTFQYRAGTVSAPMAMGGHEPAAGHDAAEPPETGGLVEMDERGVVIRSRSAADPTIGNRYIYPYSVLPLPALDRAVVTTTDMNEANLKATSEWVQVWRLSDLTLLKTFALEPGPRGDEHQLSGEPRALPDGRSAYLHTFNCGVYLLRDFDRDTPTATFVWGFPGKDCGVPVLTGHYWLQPVPETHAVVALDISDPEHPREVSSVAVGDDEKPHWIAVDPAGRRVVVNSGGYAQGNRVFVLTFDQSTGRLAIDDRFRDPGSARPGIDLTNRTWPHGFTGTALPHGTVFSR